MRRFVSITALVALSVGMIVPGASADNAPVTTVSYRGLPAHWQAETDKCPSGRKIALNVAHVKGPATPPNGNGSLRIGQADSATAIAVKAPGSTAPALSSLTNANIDFYSPKHGGLTPALSLLVTAGSTPYVLVGLSKSKGSWTNLNLKTATLAWEGGDGTLTTGTLAQFEDTFQDATLAGFLIGSASGCATGDLYLDGFHYTIGTVNVKINFDAPRTTVLTNITRASRVIAAHHLTALTVRLKQGATELSAQPVQLWVRAKGAKAYRKLRTVNTNRVGLASTKVAPATTSTYQWRYAGANSYAVSKSAISTLTVG